MVNIEVYGSNGKMIPYDRLSAMSVPCNHPNEEIANIKKPVRINVVNS